MEATFFIFMAYSKVYAWGLMNLTLGVAFSGFAISGFNVNHLDIAPRYASILMGLSNGIGTVAGGVLPHVMHAIVPDKAENSEVSLHFPLGRCTKLWLPLLYFSSGILHFGSSF